MTLTAQITGTGAPPSGTVIFRNGASQLGTGTLSSSGIATYSTSALGAGSYSFTAAYGGNSNYLRATSRALDMAVDCPTPTLALSTTTPRTLLSDPVTLVATVTSSDGTPTGQVRFMDGNQLLGQVPLLNGQAVFSTATLSIGLHFIQAVYDANAFFGSASAPALPVTVLEFGLNVPISSQTVFEGGTASYLANITPTSGATLPLPANLAITGLPPGASATLSPSLWVAGPSNTWTLAANTALPVSTLCILTRQVRADLHSDQPDRRGWPLICLALLLPFLGPLGRVRNQFRGRIYVMFLSAVGASTLLAISGCATGYWFREEHSTQYTVTITISSGNLVHSANIDLIVE